MASEHLYTILLHPAVRDSLLVSGTIQGATKEIEDLEAKLALSVEALEGASSYVADGASLSEYRDFRAALAKIKETK